jgi:hypothetical protein
MVYGSAKCSSLPISTSTGERRRGDITACGLTALESGGMSLVTKSSCANQAAFTNDNISNNNRICPDQYLVTYFRRTLHRLNKTIPDDGYVVIDCAEFPNLSMITKKSGSVDGAAADPFQ